MPELPALQTTRLSRGIDLAFRTAGDPKRTALLDDLPRMEAHVLDGGHFLLETHAARAAALMRAFLDDVLSGRQLTASKGRMS